MAFSCSFVFKYWHVTPSADTCIIKVFFKSEIKAQCLRKLGQAGFLPYIAANLVQCGLTL